jgi:hypothetical protein
MYFQKQGDNTDLVKNSSTLCLQMWTVQIHFFLRLPASITFCSVTTERI